MKNIGMKLLAGITAMLAAAFMAGCEGGGGGGGDGFDDSNVVAINETAARVGTGLDSAPQDDIINGTAAVGGRTITGVRVTMNYDGDVRFPTFPDKFQIIYKGNVIADSGTTNGIGSIQGTSGGSSPLVTIRVITPSTFRNWNWSALVEFSTK